MACPHIAGIVALAKSFNPAATKTEVRALTLL
jgi:hypothetical protein